MKFFRKLLGKDRTEFLVIYVLDRIVDGDCKSRPVGKAPRFPRSYENHIKTAHNPSDGAIINDSFNDNDLILYWTNGGIDAVCFLSVDEAEKYPGYLAMSPEVLRQLDHGLQHFPR